MVLRRGALVERARLADILTPDLCVIGAGSGGLAVAEAARAYAASEVLDEKARQAGNALDGALSELLRRSAQPKRTAASS